MSTYPDEETLKDQAMTVTFKVPTDIRDETVEKIRRGLERYANTMMWVRGADVTLPEPASPVSYNPCLQGKVLIDGAESDFLIPLDNDSVGFSQWGAPNEVLWQRVALLDSLSGPAREWWADNQPEEGPDE